MLWDAWSCVYWKWAKREGEVDDALQVSELLMIDWLTDWLMGFVQYIDRYHGTCEREVLIDGSGFIHIHSTRDLSRWDEREFVHIEIVDEYDEHTYISDQHCDVKIFVIKTVVVGMTGSSLLIILYVRVFVYFYHRFFEFGLIDPHRLCIHPRSHREEMVFF